MQRTKRTSSEDSSPNGPAALGATKISFVIGQVAGGETEPSHSRFQVVARAVQPPPRKESPKPPTSVSQTASQASYDYDAGGGTKMEARNSRTSVE